MGHLKSLHETQWAISSGFENRDGHLLRVFFQFVQSSKKSSSLDKQCSIDKLVCMNQTSHMWSDIMSTTHDFDQFAVILGKRRREDLNRQQQLFDRFTRHIKTADRDLMMDWLSIVGEVRHSLEAIRASGNTRAEYDRDLKKSKVWKSHSYWENTNTLLSHAGSLSSMMCCDDRTKGYRAAGHLCFVPDCEMPDFTACCSIQLGIRDVASRFYMPAARNWPINCLAFAGRGPARNFWLCMRHANAFVGFQAEWNETRPPAESQVTSVLYSAIKTIIPLLFERFLPDINIADICNLILSYCVVFE